MTAGDVIATNGLAARLVVLPLTASDLDEVTDLETRTVAGGWSRRTFEHELVDDASRCYLVARLPMVGARRLVGYGGMQLQVDQTHITTLTVDEAFRRRGVATRLLVDLLREARSRGAASATLEVRIDNVAARRLYARLGFRPVGLRPRYYDNTVDALIMWAHDIGGAEYGRLLRQRDPVAVWRTATDENAMKG